MFMLTLQNDQGRILYLLFSGIIFVEITMIDFLSVWYHLPVTYQLQAGYALLSVIFKQLSQLLIRLFRFPIVWSFFFFFFSKLSTSSNLPISFLNLVDQNCLPSLSVLWWWGLNLGSCRCQARTLWWILSPGLFSFLMLGQGLPGNLHWPWTQSVAQMVLGPVIFSPQALVDSRQLSQAQLSLSF